MRTLRLIGLMMLLGMLSVHDAVSGDEVIYFVYAATQYAEHNLATGSYSNPLLTEIHWLPLNGGEVENRVEVPHFEKYALSPAGTHLALKGQGREGYFYILDILDVSIIMLNYQEPTQEFLSDLYAIKAGSLLWSPDGSRLAFTAAPNGNRDMRANVYVYDLTSKQVTNMTEGIPILRSLVIPSSWSPDGNWLVIYGAWSEQEMNGYIVPVFRSGAIASDGNRFLELAPNSNTCRLVWSPDIRWLASETNCFAGIGNSSGLILFPFNPEPVSYDGRRLDEVMSPIMLDWRSSGAWAYRYTDPLWSDADTLVAYRAITPITFGNLPNKIADDYTVSGLIAFDVHSFSETALIPDLMDTLTIRLDSWFVADDSLNHRGITAYNPVINRQLEFPNSIRPCPVSYALEIEAQGEFAAVLDACNSLKAQATPVVRVYETTSFSEVFSVIAEEAEYIRPLGFVRQ